MICHLAAVRRAAALLCVCLLAALAGGCGVVGAVAQIAAGEDPKKGPPIERYNGLRDQVCAVMVWAPDSVRSDFAPVRVDLGTAIQSKIIEEGQRKLKRGEVEGAQFPFPAASLVRFQEEHPDLAGQPIEQVARRLGIPRLSRLIYVELQDLQTRLPQSRDLFRGSALLTMRVVEIDGQTARVAYHAPDIRVLFPRGAQDAYAGDEKYNDQTMYVGTLAFATQEVCRRLYDTGE